jgi:hypothetical protein
MHQVIMEAAVEMALMAATVEMVAKVRAAAMAVAVAVVPRLAMGRKAEEAGEEEPSTGY